MRIHQNYLCADHVLCKGLPPKHSTRKVDMVKNVNINQVNINLATSLGQVGRQVDIRKPSSAGGILDFSSRLILILSQSFKQLLWHFNWIHLPLFEGKTVVWRTCKKFASCPNMFPPQAVDPLESEKICFLLSESPWEREAEAGSGRKLFTSSSDHCLPFKERQMYSVKMSKELFKRLTQD
jgi:hypothetical protein